MGEATKLETSMMLHLRPDLVRHDALQNFAPPAAKPGSLLGPEQPVGYAWMSQDLNPAGAVGRASRADAERGAMHHRDAFGFQQFGHEILIGMTEDPNFGPMLVYGLGGVYVELLRDVAFRLNPLTDVDAAEMIEEIKGADLLKGYRNMPLGDRAALKETLLRVSAMVTALPEIIDMDLNPVKVLEPGEGVRAVDARIKVRPTQPGWSPELLVLPAVVS